ncbi:MAG: CoB--CoM heterodisulfide reductase iron-sulfur subunit B family protein [Candidatus Bathyarchaeia archaeon]
MKYALFWGCLIPARELTYEVSVRKLMPALGVELVDMKGTNCCAPFSIQSLDYASWLALAARNLCIGEEMGADIMTLCNDCYESLLMVNTILKTNPNIKDQVNEILSSVGKEFKGNIEVKHMVDVLYDDVGVKRIKEAVNNPFTGLRVATQPGCHLTKPKRIHFGVLRGFEALDGLVKATGAESVDYERRDMCCGGPLRGINDELARNVARIKLTNIKNAGADCIVTVCPFCFVELDPGQLEIKRHFKEEYNLPVLHLAELLRMAMGMKLDDWEIRSHRISLDPILKNRLKEG